MTGDVQDGSARNHVERNGWYPPPSTYDYAMPINEVLRLACLFQPEGLCLS
jgi:hypothetical protein